MMIFASLLTADDKTPKSCRSNLVQLSLNSMKAAGVCIGRPVLLTSDAGHQQVLSLFHMHFWCHFNSGLYSLFLPCHCSAGVLRMACCYISWRKSWSAEMCPEQPESEDRGQGDGAAADRCCAEG